MARVLWPSRRRARGEVALAIAWALAVGGSACGNRPDPGPTDKPDRPDKKDAGPADAGALEIAARPLGLADLAAYGWRARDGHASFRLARRAEERGDWPAVVATCQQALAADPGHLEAAWLLAVGLAKIGKLDQVLAPLHQTVAGDFAHWGEAALQQPGLQDFLATPTGAAWRVRVDEDRARYAAAISRAVIVTSEGKLHAFEVDTGRWHRLTRAPGHVIGALAVPAARKIAYVSRSSRKARHELGVGVIDLARGRVSRPVPLGTPGPISIAFSAKAPGGFWIGSGAPRQAVWRRLDDEYRLHALPPRTPRPAGPWLEVSAKGSVRLHARPPNVTADWDHQSLASAIRIGTSNRIVSVPSPGLIDGDTAVWSPDRVHLAFVAQLDDHCTAGAASTAAFVADAATGGIAELERAAGGIALSWLAERTLVIAGDHGVSIKSLDDSAPVIQINGATGLLIPRQRPRCTPQEIDEAAGDAEAAEPGAGDEPVDAGVVDAP